MTIRLVGLALWLGVSATVPGTPAQAQDVKAESAVAVDESGLAKAAVLIEPEVFTAFSPGLELTGSLRIESAGSRTGPGSRGGFSPVSAPLIKGEDVRIEIDELYFSIPTGAVEFTLGKQEIAWGSIDGARIVDTISPARLTEGLARDPRPDRIGIWAARMQASLGRVDLDLVAAPDPTVNQLAEPGAAFFPKAPRFLAGLQPIGPLPPIDRSPRDDLIGDATLGARVSYRLDATDIRLSLVRGIDQDGVPVFDAQRIALSHPRRHTIGAEFVRQIGAVVARFETAWTPDARFNVAQTFGTETVNADRIISGIGADFSGPFDTYINVQLIVDHVISERPLVRPVTDVIGTLRIQKDFEDGENSLRFEHLGSFTDGDGLLRFEFQHRLTGQLAVFTGADLFYGTRAGIFGQFVDQSRIVSGARFSF